jgi:hypothetical protein
LFLYTDLKICASGRISILKKNFQTKSILIQ